MLRVEEELCPSFSVLESAFDSLPGRLDPVVLSLQHVTNEPSSSRSILSVLFFGVLIAALDIAILGPSFRSINAFFEVDERTGAWVFIMFTLFTQVGIPLMSGFADRSGYRRAFSFGIGCFLVGLVLLVTAQSYAMLLVGRAFQGLGAAGLVPIASAVIGEIYPPEQRGRKLGLIGAVFGIAFIIGPIMSAVLIPYGWQWPFIILLPIALFVGTLSLRVLPHSPKISSAQPIDWTGTLTLIAGMVALALAINLIDQENLVASLSRPIVWGGLIAAVVFVGLFVVIEQRSKHPYLRLELFRSSQVRIASLVSVGAGAAEATFLFLPSFAAVAYGVSDSRASMMLMPLVLALFVGSPLAGRLLDRLGSRTLVMAGTLITGVGMGLLGTGNPSIVIYYLGTAAIGLGLAVLLGSALSYILLNEARDAERTVAQGVIRLFKGVGRLIGGALIGAMAASGGLGIGGYQTGFLAVGSLCVILFIFSAGLKKRVVEMVD